MIERWIWIVVMSVVVLGCGEAIVQPFLDRPDGIDAGIGGTGGDGGGGQGGFGGDDDDDDDDDDIDDVDDV